MVDARLRRRGRDLDLYLLDLLVDRRGEGAAVLAGRAPDEDGGARDLADGLWIDDEHEQARRCELLDRAVGELHDEYEIGFERDDLLEVHLDAADLLDRLRRCGLVGEVVGADEPAPCAEREEELGDRRTDRDDPLGTLGDRDAAVLEVADRRREGRRRRRRGARRGGRGRGGRGVRPTGGEEEEEDREESGERHGHLAHPFLAKACKPRAGGQATRV